MARNKSNENQDANREDEQQEVDLNAGRVERTASEEDNKMTDEKQRPEADQTEQPAEMAYGEDITVRTVGDYQMYDPNTSTHFPADKAVKTKYTRFIEGALRQGKMREGAADGMETIEVSYPVNEGIEGRGEGDRADRQTTAFTRGSTGDEAKSRRSVS